MCKPPSAKGGREGGEETKEEEEEEEGERGPLPNLLKYVWVQQTRRCQGEREGRKEGRKGGGRGERREGDTSSILPPQSDWSQYVARSLAASFSLPSVV